MTPVIVTTALALLIETLPLDTMDVDHPQFHHLYSLECQLFDTLRQMTEEQEELYLSLTQSYRT
jgi:hypothetical protein